MENTILKYKGNEISFLNGKDVRVNATEMAKPFGKRPADWLRLPSARSFVNALCEVRNSHITPNDLIHTQKGNSPDFSQGTWMHEDVALEFSRWLSPEFAIWCNDRIKELVKHGFTATNQKLEEIANNPDLLIELATNLKNERAAKERLQVQTQKQQEALQQAAPKVEYFNQVLQSESTYNTNKIAKELGMSAVTLNRMLCKKKVQYKQKDTWLLYHRYQGKGYTKTKTYTYTGPEGESRTSMQTVWTEKGRLFIHEMLKK